MTAQPDIARAQLNQFYPSLLVFEQAIRHAQSDQELIYTLVNDGLKLVGARQSFFWRPNHSRNSLIVSGVSAVNREAPFVQWLEKVLSLTADDLPPEGRIVTAADLPIALQGDWAHWLPASLFLLPLYHDGRSIGIYAAALPYPPNSAQKTALAVMSDVTGHAWNALGSKRKLVTPRQGLKTIILAAMIVLVALLAIFPIASSIIAPAEVVPSDPIVIRAGLDGVIDEVLVAPNDRIAAGQVIARFDVRKIEAQRLSTLHALMASETELRQLHQAALSDMKARMAIPSTEGKIEQQKTELHFLESQKARLEVRAPRAGIAIFDNPSELVGKTVSVGERLMLLADPNNVQLEIRLPVSDGITFPQGADVLFFRNIDPEKPIAARLIYQGYRAIPGPDGVVSYKLKAEFSEPDTPRIGLKGTAKIYGEEVPLIYFVLRRPLAYLRAYLGL